CSDRARFLSYLLVSDKSFGPGENPLPRRCDCFSTCNLNHSRRRRNQHSGSNQRVPVISLAPEIRPQLLPDLPFEARRTNEVQLFCLLRKHQPEWATRSSSSGTAGLLRPAAGRRSFLHASTTFGHYPEFGSGECDRHSAGGSQRRHSGTSALPVLLVPPYEHSRGVFRSVIFGLTPPRMELGEWPPPRRRRAPWPTGRQAPEHSSTLPARKGSRGPAGTSIRATLLPAAWEKEEGGPWR